MTVCCPSLYLTVVLTPRSIGEKDSDVMLFCCWQEVKPFLKNSLGPDVGQTSGHGDIDVDWT